MAVANGSEHSSPVQLTVRFARKSDVIDVIECQDPLATANGSVLQDAVELKGQVVCCADCWAEVDRNKVAYDNSEDLLNAKSCVEGGDPTLLAVREGDEFKLYQLARGKFRLPGKNWLEFVGKLVSVIIDVDV